MWQIDGTSLKPGGSCLHFMVSLAQARSHFLFKREENALFFFFVCPAKQMASFEQAQVRGTVLAALSNPLEGLTRCRVMKGMKPSK